jgi:proteasome accessory factor B
VPIEQEIVMGGEYAGQTRYWIDRRALRAARARSRRRRVAGAAGGDGGHAPGSTSGQEALWKLGAGALDRSAAISAVLPDLPALPVLREAVAQRTAVSFTYRDVARDVDPWGLLLRDGFWYLVGFDHARGERRTYRIDRIEGAVSLLAGRTFERPDGFDPRDALPADPKQIGAADDVRRRLDRPDRRAPRSGALAPTSVTIEWRPGIPTGRSTSTCRAANLPAFRSWLLGFLEHAEVLEPAEVRESRDRLARGRWRRERSPSPPPRRGAPPAPARDAPVADGARGGAGRRGRQPGSRSARTNWSRTWSSQRCVVCHRSSTS